MGYYTLYDEESSRGYSENNPKQQMTITDLIFWIIVAVFLILGIIVKIEDWINNKKTKK